MGIILLIIAALVAASFIYEIGKLTMLKLKEKLRRVRAVRLARQYVLADLKAIVRDPEVTRVTRADLDRMIEEGCTYAELQVSSNGQPVGKVNIHKKEYPDQEEDSEARALMSRNNGIYIENTDRVIETPASVARTAEKYGAKIRIIGE